MDRENCFKILKIYFLVLLVAGTGYAEKAETGLPPQSSLKFDLKKQGRNAASSSIKNKVSFQNLFLSTASGGSGQGSFNSMYLGSLIYKPQDKIIFNVTWGMDIVNFNHINEVNTFGFAETPGIGNIKGLSAVFSDPKAGTLTLEYGATLGKNMKSENLFNLNSTDFYSLNKTTRNALLDSLKLKYQKSFFNGKFNIETVIQTGPLGLK